MKKIILIAQAKGGCGKSVLTWLLAQKHQEAIFLDMDDATTTTMKQLKYINPKQVTFLSETKTIDRGKFNDFLEYISSHKKDLFICDLGSSISEQLPHFINDFSAEFLKSALDSLKIEMQIICVVGGQNIFSACMDYLQELAHVLSKQIKISIAINDHFMLDEIQNTEFKNFANAMKIKEVFHFNLSRDKNASTQDRVTQILKEGNGLQGASILTKELLKNAVNNIPSL